MIFVREGMTHLECTCRFNLRDNVSPEEESSRFRNVACI